MQRYLLTSVRPSAAGPAPRRYLSTRQFNSPVVHHGNLVVADKSDAISRQPDQTHMSIDDFRENHFTPAQPLLLKGAFTAGGAGVGGQSKGVPLPLPAMSKWFPKNDQGHHGISEKLLQNIHDVALSYEVRRLNPHPQDVWEKFLAWLQADKSKTSRHAYKTLYSGLNSGIEGPTFHAFGSSIYLLAKALEFNALQEDGADIIQNLYIAQQSVEDMPKSIQHDVHPPPLVKLAGKGDSYGSSIWVGLEPTFTPWHRDPNPNLFVQIVGQKTIRFMPAQQGKRLYRHVASIVQSPSNPGMRGLEMMEGLERETFFEAVWGPSCPDGMFEVTVSPGDALFLPHVWWHSVRSIHDDGRLNASVNWWFR